jgi:hypothetical protein
VEIDEAASLPWAALPLRPDTQRAAAEVPTVPFVRADRRPACGVWRRLRRGGGAAVRRGDERVRDDGGGRMGSTARQRALHGGCSLGLGGLTAELLTHLGGYTTGSNVLKERRSANAHTGGGDAQHLPPAGDGAGELEAQPNLQGGRRARRPVGLPGTSRRGLCWARVPPAAIAAEWAANVVFVSVAATGCHRNVAPPKNQRP